MSRIVGYKVEGHPYTPRRRGESDQEWEDRHCAICNRLVDLAEKSIDFVNPFFRQNPEGYIDLRTVPVYADEEAGE